MISDKKLARIESLLGVDTLSALDSAHEGELEITIVSSESAMKQAAEELEANPKFLELKASLSTLTSGLKEVNKRQKAKIAYCLHVLETRGKQ